MSVDPFQPAPRPSIALVRAMWNHRYAYRCYDRTVPQADPQDPRYDSKAVDRLGHYQRREARYRRALLSQPVGSLADMQVKAEYLLDFPGDDYLISDTDELALLLRAMQRSIRPGLQ